MLRQGSARPLPPGEHSRNDQPGHHLQSTHCVPVTPLSPSKGQFTAEGTGPEWHTPTSTTRLSTTRPPGLLTQNKARDDIGGGHLKAKPQRGLGPGLGWGAEEGGHQGDGHKTKDSHSCSAKDWTRTGGLTGHSGKRKWTGPQRAVLQASLQGGTSSSEPGHHGPPVPWMISPKSRHGLCLPPSLPQILESSLAPLCPQWLEQK